MGTGPDRVWAAWIRVREPESRRRRGSHGGKTWPTIHPVLFLGVSWMKCFRSNPTTAKTAQSVEPPAFRINLSREGGKMRGAVFPPRVLHGFLHGASNLRGFGWIRDGIRHCGGRPRRGWRVIASRCGATRSRAHRGGPLGPSPTPAVSPQEQRRCPLKSRATAVSAAAGPSAPPPTRDGRW